MLLLIFSIALIDCALATPVDPLNCGVPKIEPDLTILEDRIVGGSQAINHSWPWQIQIRQNGRHFCGGSIISPDWILSAAHCFSGYAASSFSFRAGRRQKMRSEQYEQISNPRIVITHESFNTITLDNDVAVIRVTPPFKYTDQVSPVCLPTRTTELEAGHKTYVTGWGSTKLTGKSNYLQQVMVPIISRATCNQRSYYNGAINNGMICAGYEDGGKDSCQGDSGGPLVAKVGHKFEQYGVVSWGAGCAEAKKPGVYANIMNYKSWILKKVTQIEEEERQVEATFQPRPFGSAFREQVQKMVLAGEIDDTDLPMGNDWLFKE